MVVDGALSLATRVTDVINLCCWSERLLFNPSTMCNCYLDVKFEADLKADEG